MEFCKKVCFSPESPSPTDQPPRGTSLAAGKGQLQDAFLSRSPKYLLDMPVLRIQIL